MGVLNGMMIDDVMILSLTNLQTRKIMLVE